MMVQLVAAHRSLFPKDSERVLTILLDTTYGATADASLTPRVESVAARGRSGDMKTFVAELTACRKAMAELREAVLKNPEKAGAALGPNIWLLSDAPIGGPDKEAETAINLNTAERDELLKLPGVDEAAATKLLESRRSAGLFLNVNDFAARAQLSPDVTTRLAAMTRAMDQAGVYSRE
jgi:DNA uptake protein ComE-like DNA-binding protein